jgi:hypothetical protein
MGGTAWDEVAATPKVPRGSRGVKRELARPGLPNVDRARPRRSGNGGHAPQRGVMVSTRTSGGAWFETRSVVRFGAIALFTAAIGRAQELKRKLAVDCASLKEFSIPASAIALPTAGDLVQSAEAVAADAEKNINGAFCKVTGVIRNATASTAVFEFEVILPDAWNGRAVYSAAAVTMARSSPA